MRRLVVLVVILWCGAANAQTTIFNCSSGFAASGSCGVSFIGFSGQPFGVLGGPNGSTPALSGTKVNLLPSGFQHQALSMIWQTAVVNIQAFNATVLFIPNGYNVMFMVENSNNNPSFNGSNFAAGAGCEADFFQGFSQTNPPNNVFAVEFDSWNPLTNGGSFSYSSVQIYQSNGATTASPYVQCPCEPTVEGCGTNNSQTPINKISTSPVPLNSPSGTAQTTTGDTYSANFVYDGNNFTVHLYDVTASGTCTPVTSPTCFSNTWTGVNIPTSVGASSGSSNTAWVGLGGAIPSITPSNSLYITGFTYIQEPVGGTQAHMGNGGMW